MVLTKKCEVEVLVRGAHETIIEGLMKLDEAQLQEGLQWSRSNYGKLDVVLYLQKPPSLNVWGLF